MPVLPEPARGQTWRQIMSGWSSSRVGCPLSKSQLRDAINAADDWIDGNTASYNQALPLPARQNLTPAQKAELLLFVIQRRFGEGV